ncbi:hypothetical protein NPIL_460341 [Nephila pilipes]|uniref:Uncharacterized protein n=1 Tax=Nephila pilipes TaxID=299642 RepID=A0A8X6N3B7_NEPPI|nr:hypothetical protein NPIL_460341 [Nephila pilipes]
MANKSPEYMFATDVIRYVLVEYWTGLNWMPSGIFVHQYHGSPFSPAVQRIIKETLDSNGAMLHEKYDQRFPVKNIFSHHHYEFCQELIQNEVENEDVRVIFLSMCAVLTFVTALSVLYGIKEAPDICHRAILGHFLKLRNRGSITDTFWEEMQVMCVQWQQ